MTEIFRICIVCLRLQKIFLHGPVDDKLKKLKFLSKHQSESKRLRDTELFSLKCKYTCYSGLQVTKKSLICKDCSQMISTLFDFKNQCFLTEDKLKKYPTTNNQVVLKFLLKQNIVDSYLKQTQVCRLCLNFADINSFDYLKKVLENDDIRNIFQDHLSELVSTQKNLEATADPVICKNCLKSLIQYSDLLFLLNDIKEASKHENESDSEKKMVVTKTVQVNGYLSCNLEDQIVAESMSEDETTEDKAKEQIYRKVKGNKRSSKKNCLTISKNKVQNTHKEIQTVSVEDDLKKHMCEVCGYRTNITGNLTTHLKTHNSAENTIYECQFCDFKTKLENYLKKHIKNQHRDESEVNWYKCVSCSYRTKHKYILLKHIKTRHEHCAEEMLKCEFCNFETKLKENLKKHFQVMHIDYSKKQTFKCKICDYQTKVSSYYKRHINGHGKMFICDMCPFQTKHSASLTKHIYVRHNSISESDMYQCELCDFKAKLPRYVKKHFLRAHF